MERLGAVCSTRWKLSVMVRMRCRVRLSKACEVAHLSRMRQGEALKGGVVGAGQDPGFVGGAGGVGAEGDEVSANFDDALGLLHLLGQHVAEHAALFLLEIIRPERNS